MKRCFLILGLAFSSNVVLADDLYCRLKGPIGEITCSISSNLRWEGGWDGEVSYQVEYFKVLVQDSSRDGRYCVTNTYYSHEKAHSELEFLRGQGVCPVE